jgi:hypothetical protein
MGWPALATIGRGKTCLCMLSFQYLMYEYLMQWLCNYWFPAGLQCHELELV